MFVAGDMGVMFFLLRMAFWLSIVLILLPTATSQPVPANSVGATDAISAASATVGDLRQQARDHQLRRALREDREP